MPTGEIGAKERMRHVAELRAHRTTTARALVHAALGQLTHHVGDAVCRRLVRAPPVPQSPNQVLVLLCSGGDVAQRQ